MPSHCAHAVQRALILYHVSVGLDEGCSTKACCACCKICARPSTCNTHFHSIPNPFRPEMPAMHCTAHGILSGEGFDDV